MDCRWKKCTGRTAELSVVKTQGYHIKIEQGTKTILEQAEICTPVITSKVWCCENSSTLPVPLFARWTFVVLSPVKIQHSPLGD
jgi:hypothetical protein